MMLPPSLFAPLPPPAPQEVQDLHQVSLPTGFTGTVFPVAGFDKSRTPQEQHGGVPPRAALAWGPAAGAASSELVCVSALGSTALFLHAGYKDGMLFLLASPNSQEGTAGGSTDSSGGGFIAAHSNGFLEPQERANTPPCWIAHMDIRDSFLKSGNAWRIDVDWAVLANWWEPPKDRYDSDALVHTIWMVPVGNILCFYHTEGRVTTLAYQYDDQQGKWVVPDVDDRKIGHWLRYSMFGHFWRNRKLAVMSNWDGIPFNHYGQVSNIITAPLPWELSGEPTADVAPDGKLPGILGTQNLVWSSLIKGPFRPGKLAPPIMVCPRWHGMFVPGPNAYQKASFDDVDIDFPNAHRFLYDPLAVEFRGIAVSSDFAFPGEKAMIPVSWPQPVPPFYETCRFSYTNADGNEVFVKLAGTHTDAVLLTASNAATQWNSF